MANSSINAAIFVIFIFRVVSGAALDAFLREDEDSCELKCKDPDTPELAKSCMEGCRLYKIIGLAKGYNNKTVELCYGACSEAFINETTADACKYGCQHFEETKSKEDIQTIHLLTPLLFMKSAYNTMAHHMRQFVSSSVTVYFEAGPGNMVVLQSGPKIEEVRSRHIEEDRLRFMKNFRPQVESENKVDWMDCLLQQSGLPKFILVLALFGIIIVLIWLCCATAVTAPHHYVGSSKDPKRKFHYVLLTEPNTGDIKCPQPIINSNEDAPPLPPKASII